MQSAELEFDLIYVFYLIVLPCIVYNTIVGRNKIVITNIYMHFPLVGIVQDGNTKRT